MSALYFAYGSNMAPAEIDAWCEGHRVIGPARLDGYTLGLRRRSIRWAAGVLDLVPTPGETVWGVLYELPPEGVARLDEKEGAGFAYRRIEVRPELDGEPRDAIAYEVISKETRDIPPAAEYRDLVLAAARERGLPTGWLRELEHVCARSRRIP